MAKEARKLTAGVWTRVTPATHRAMENAAAEAGLTLPEWTRRALESAVEVDRTTRILLAEITSLKKLVLNIQAETARKSGVPDSQLEDLYNRVEARKYAYAEAAIQDGRRA